MPLQFERKFYAAAGPVTEEMRFRAVYGATPGMGSWGYPTNTSDANVRAFVNTVRQVLSEMDYLKGG